MKNIINEIRTRAGIFGVRRLSRTSFNLLERSAARPGPRTEPVRAYTPSSLAQISSICTLNDQIHPIWGSQRRAFSVAATPNPPSSNPPPLNLLASPTRYLFFTGKGGVGKTSIACATAIQLAQQGKRVLLVSTDPASNLDEMLETPISSSETTPTPIPGIPNLFALNIDPDAAAESYRARVISQMPPETTENEKDTVREELSGACTIEIAAFDEFAGLLSGDAIVGTEQFDHVVFDTAPTGHTLRLLSLPALWSGFLQGNDRGASCLGPHSGLKMQEAKFNRALKTLADKGNTRIVLVTRPEPSALKEAERTHDELDALGLRNQWLVVNGVLESKDVDGDKVAKGFAAVQKRALEGMPETIGRLPRDTVPLRAFDMVGLPALNGLLDPRSMPITNPASPQSSSTPPPSTHPLSSLVDLFAAKDSGLIMVLGKGGVGKTTIAASLAIALAERGKSVHLSTTDPAAHLASTLQRESQQTDSTNSQFPFLSNLQVDKIDPKLETANYISKIMSTKGRNLDSQQRALMLEDLQSPCTEEVAVFHAFSRTVASARNKIVILDTAPTGHTLLLMDATGAYHRQIAREINPGLAKDVKTPLTRLQDGEYTKVVLVTLPERTPVSEAAALQEDLKRAKIEPFAWVVNRTLVGSGTKDPILNARVEVEKRQVERIIKEGLAKRTYLVPWQEEPPVGVAALKKLSC